MKPAKGQVFIHNNMPDPYWKPSRGQKEEERPLAIMVITSVRNNKVYFRYIDDISKSAKFSMSIDNWGKHYASKDSTQNG